MTVPNQITFFRIILIPLFVYLLLAESLPGSKWIAASLFIILSLSDVVDGFLARRLKQTSELGKLLDPIADKLLVFAAFLTFIELGKLPSFIVFILLGRDMLVMGLRTWEAKKGSILPADNLGKWKTFFQLFAVIFLILNLPMQYLIFYVSVFLSLYSGWNYFRNLNLGI